MAIPYTSSQSGSRITVNHWTKEPLSVQAYMIDWAAQGRFLVDAVLRNAGNAPAGVVRFEESTPLYADSSVTNRAEGAEVPVARVSRGTPNVAYSVDKALRVLITNEMVRRNSIDVLQTSLTQVKNTMHRAFDQMFIDAIMNASILSQAASGLWSNTATDIRGDILKAAELIEGAQDAQGSELGYSADTLLVNRVTKYNIITSDQFNKVFEGGNIADENLRYTGKLSNKILTFDVLESPLVPSGTALLCQRQQCGFIADEVPFHTTPLDEDRNRLSWSSIVQRVSAVGIDQPKAICKITGVGTT